MLRVNNFGTKYYYIPKYHIVYQKKNVTLSTVKQALTPQMLIKCSKT